jgi:Helix-turn-helix domain
MRHVRAFARLWDGAGALPLALPGLLRARRSWRTLDHDLRSASDAREHVRPRGRTGTNVCADSRAGSVFEIGSSLREARTRQGLELHDAQRATRIRTKYLAALEAEQFDQLPAEAYAKAFLHTYADYLGLDGSLYVAELDARFEAKQTGTASAAQARRQPTQPRPAHGRGSQPRSARRSRGRARLALRRRPGANPAGCVSSAAGCDDDGAGPTRGARPGRNLGARPPRRSCFARRLLALRSSGLERGARALRGDAPEGRLAPLCPQAPLASYRRALEPGGEAERTGATASACRYGERLRHTRRFSVRLADARSCVEVVSAESAFGKIVGRSRSERLPRASQRG